MSKDEETGFVHVTCPKCGEPGAAVNQPTTGEVWVEDVDNLGYCYGDFGVVFHKPSAETSGKTSTDTEQEGDR